MVQNFIQDRNNNFDEGPRLGLSVAEEEGKLIDTMQSRIRQGVGDLELQFGSQGGIMTGPDAVGKETRKAMKELAELNQVEITAVHGTSAITGFSGYDQRSGKFDENYRTYVLDHFKSVIDFASDVAPGAGVVLHSGEFRRPMISDKKFKGQFQTYLGEERTAPITFVDRADGSTFGLGRDAQIPIAVEKEVNGQRRLEIETKDWNDFHEELETLKQQKGEKSGRNSFIKQHFEDVKQFIPEETRKEMMREDIDLAGYAEIVEYFKGKSKEAEAQVNRWKAQYEDASLKRDEAQKMFDSPSSSEEQKAHAERALKVYENEMRYSYDLEQQQINQMNSTFEKMANIAPLKDVALKRTSDTLAKAAVHAFDVTKAKKFDKPLHIVPENINPEDFGSHPDEMIEIVTKARKAFVEKLIKKEIEDPTLGPKTIRDDQGKLVRFEKRMIRNPDFHPGISEDQAKKLAEKHIKATLDFQHLGRYKRYFMGKPEWSYEKREKEWNKWYQQQVKKLADSGILGHVHLVDGFGNQLAHLPPGEGSMPLREEMEGAGMDVIDYLKSKSRGGKDISWTSEGWGEGPERHLFKSQEFFGEKFFPENVAGGSRWWANPQTSYGGHAQSPSYFFGELSKELTQEEYAPWAEPDVWCNQW